MSQKGTLKYLVEELQRAVKATDTEKDIDAGHLWYAVRGALDPGLLVSNLAEALRISAGETETLLTGVGFGDVVARQKMSSRGSGGGGDATSGESRRDYCIAPDDGNAGWKPFEDLFSVAFSPPVDQPVALSPERHDALSMMVENITASAPGDAFAALYRDETAAYHRDFMARTAPEIDAFLSRHFIHGRPRYLVNSGIGANEQFNHFVARLHNATGGGHCRWLIIDSPRQLRGLPDDATVENTLFMEFSRSGKTEETVKVHEYTDPRAKRIVFANSGPLRELGERDGNLLLPMPDQVSGRFGRNKTPILLAPMYVAGMDTHAFWETIERAIRVFDLSSAHSLPARMAQFIYLYQQQNGINHIYLGCNDDDLACSADELLQFWNEGVNKNRNDISMSRYLGLPRDSHLNIEGILANHRTKMGLFLLRDSMTPEVLPALTHRVLDNPINPLHKGLRQGEEEVILAEANYRRFAELMPAIKLTVHGGLTATHAAVLGQLWADVTFFYSRLVNVDPGSNPEVKSVRDRARDLLIAR